MKGMVVKQFHSTSYNTFQLTPLATTKLEGSTTYL
jgi:hypothetical protein